MIRIGMVAVGFGLLCAACGQLPPTPVPEAEAPHDHAVVFDIDGTLTPNVLAVFEARPDAAAAAQAFASKGYQVFYLSARVSWLTAGIPDWLAEHGFPEGSIHVAMTSEQRDNPASFKAARLREFQARGWHIDYGFGDSSTDFQAYAEAGIPESQVFALRRRGEDQCESGPAADCLGGWATFLPVIRDSVPARGDAPGVAPGSHTP